MSEGIGVELGTALQYIEDKARVALGYDQASIEFRALLDKHMRHALRDAATVQIIGMYRPVSIFDIYQPTTLTAQWQKGVITVRDLLDRKENAVVFGGPGRGKTIFLHYLFATVAKNIDVVPLLFTLRWPGAGADLVSFIEQLGKGRKVRREPLLLLVDGLDEIPSDERKHVVGALRAYSALEVGTFILSCRTFYHVFDLKATHYELAPFSRYDSTGFINAFARAYKTDIDADALLVELNRHGFEDFASHPLMLAMICILKSGPMPELPQTPIRLIRRALDTLTLRWDDQKGVRRESRLSLDGDDRVRCLMQIAYAMRNLIESTNVVEHVAGVYLKLLQRHDIRPSSLLEEIAQWYGVFVPASEGEWTFVHRTIHDYLAARYWVESGTFVPDRVAEWTPRAAYAACLVPDATRSIVVSLAQSADVAVLTECLYNRALFASDEVAAAIADHFERVPHSYQRTGVHGQTHFSTHKDFFPIATDELLYALLRLASGRRSDQRSALLILAAAELKRRGRRPSPAIIRQVSAVLGRDTQYITRRGSDMVTVTMAELYSS